MMEGGLCCSLPQPSQTSSISLFIVRSFIYSVFFDLCNLKQLFYSSTFSPWLASSVSRSTTGVSAGVRWTFLLRSSGEISVFPPPFFLSLQYIFDRKRHILLTTNLSCTKRDKTFLYTYMFCLGHVPADQ